MIIMARRPATEMISLPADDRAATTARRCLTQFTDNPGFPRESYADLLLTELVTNAVKATEPPASRIRVLFRYAYRALTMSVWDSSPKEPVVIESGEGDALLECGRGLLLVRELSDDWGWRPLPEPTGGKLVWCAVALNVTFTEK